MSRSLFAAIAALALLCASATADEPPSPAPPMPVPTPPTRSATVGVIAKVHNVDLGGGRLALRLSVPADLVGWKGESVGMDVWFADSDGRLVRSAVSGYADSSGYLHLSSRDAKVEKDVEPLAFVFTVPYSAFPCPAPGASYSVTATASLSSRSSPKAGASPVLARGTTTFRVEG
jgi:hypothetical protein